LLLRLELYEGAMWDSLDQYLKTVRPASKLNHRGMFRGYKWSTALSRAARATREFDKLKAMVEALEEAHDAKDYAQVRSIYLKVVIGAETLLLYCEPLSRLPSTKDFTYDFDLLNHFDRYAEQRLQDEIELFLGSAKPFLTEADQYFEEAGSFITKDLHELPD